MMKRIPLSNLLLLMLALGVLGATLYEYVVTRNGSAVALQEEGVEEGFEEEFEEELERFECSALAQLRLLDWDPRVGLGAYFATPLRVVPVARFMGWSLPLRL
jgi:hypothetical protein